MMQGTRTAWALTATAALCLLAAAPAAEAAPHGQALNLACNAAGPASGACHNAKFLACGALWEYGGFADRNIRLVARFVPEPAGSVIDDEAKVQSGVKCF